MACKVKITKSGPAFRLHYEGWHSWEGTKYQNTPENRKETQNTARIISAEMKARRFNYLAWFPEGNRADQYRPKSDEKPTPKTIREAYDEWITDKIPPLVKKSRARKYRSHFAVHILPFQGDKALVEYGVNDITKILLKLVDKKKLGVKSARNVINASLRALFRDAKASGWTERNPFDDLPRN